ncbi:MAG: hypothetical protein BWY76_01436 [bacterium ADurb.Bin429]|nr:MAG: hypothetical protein BWY76_01436 [bacterium ADurb.Bin429]
MAATSQSAEQEPMFGLMQGFSMGTLLLLGGLLAVPMVKFGWARTISDLAPTTIIPLLVGLLWLLEAIAYALIAGLLSRNILVALSGAVLGFITRFIVFLLMGVLVSSQNGVELSDTLMGMDGPSWAYRALAMLVTGTMLLLPFRRMLQTGYGLIDAPAPSPSASRAKQFSFASKAPRTGHYQIVRSAPTAQTAPATTAAAPTAPRHPVIQPPENFTPVIPRDNVFGTVSVPASVILASVPEAQPFLEADKPVTIHLAYLVPQLQRGTAWLIWQQIFSAPGGGARPANEQADAGVRDRWVKISPKYFITQVPREYFEIQRIPPAWMRLPAVPQESQFDDVE